MTLFIVLSTLGKIFLVIGCDGINGYFHAYHIVANNISTIVDKFVADPVVINGYPAGDTTVESCSFVYSLIPCPVLIFTDPVITKYKTLSHLSSFICPIIMVFIFLYKPVSGNNYATGEIAIDIFVSQLLFFCELYV